MNAVGKIRVGKMPPKLDDKSPTVRLNIVTPAAWLARINAWRRQQPDLPNVSEAIRRLVEMALDAERGRKK